MVKNSYVTWNIEPEFFASAKQTKAPGFVEINTYTKISWKMQNLFIQTVQVCLRDLPTTLFHGQNAHDPDEWNDLNLCDIDTLI